MQRNQLKTRGFIEKIGLLKKTDVKNEDADRFVREARSREQANLVPTDETGVRQIFKALKQGETTVILPDHTPNVGGDMINYFGVPLASSNLSAKLIQKTKAK
mgnify:CR=1 FL=1